jgi:hypothetical protein
MRAAYLAKPEIRMNPAISLFLHKLTICGGVGPSWNGRFAPCFCVVERRKMAANSPIAHSEPVIRLSGDRGCEQNW